MPTVGCPYPGCDYQTDDGEAAVIAAQLNIHAYTHRPAAQSTPAATSQKPPNMERPVILRETTAEDWEIFTRKWDLFKQATDIPNDQLTNHLWQCCEPTLATDLFRQIADITKVGEESVLQAIKSLAVINVASSVR